MMLLATPAFAFAFASALAWAQAELHPHDFEQVHDRALFFSPISRSSPS